MYQYLTYPRDGYDEGSLKKDLIYKLITKHSTEGSRLKKLKSYYLGEHAILNHKRRNENAPNYKTVANPCQGYCRHGYGLFYGQSHQVQ